MALYYNNIIIDCTRSFFFSKIIIHSNGAILRFLQSSPSYFVKIMSYLPINEYKGTRSPGRSELALQIYWPDYRFWFEGNKIKHLTSRFNKFVLKKEIHQRVYLDKRSSVKRWRVGLKIFLYMEINDLSNRRLLNCIISTHVFLYVNGE